MPRNLKGNTASERGRDYENYIADKLGAKTVKGSGSLWYNSQDVANSSILFSCKYTEKNSYAISQGVIQEVSKAASQENKIPGIVLGIGDDDLVCLKLEDFKELMANEKKPLEKSEKEQKKAEAKIPRLLRD